MTEAEAKKLIADGTIRKGMTKAEVRAAFGQPDATGMPTRKSSGHLCGYHRQCSHAL